MLIHELQAAECAAVLRQNHVARLGCARYDQPYVIPIQFSFDEPENCVYAFSMVGQKIEWMRENPKVCLEVEDITDKNHWTTVVATGRYEEIGREPTDAGARERAERLFRQRPEWWLPGGARVLSHDHQEVVIYRIRIDRMSGRRAARDVR
jgi:nitroimidazol reductase NimA-like FMN-containing flavoprotein (pyridoxamine 5'-phosphate oxidase superfamily)